MYMCVVSVRIIVPKSGPYWRSSFLGVLGWVSCGLTSGLWLAHSRQVPCIRYVSLNSLGSLAQHTLHTTQVLTLTMSFSLVGLGSTECFDVQRTVFIVLAGLVNTVVRFGGSMLGVVRLWKYVLYSSMSPILPDQHIQTIQSSPRGRGGGFPVWKSTYTTQGQSLNPPKYAVLRPARMSCLQWMQPSSDDVQSATLRMLERA